MNQQLVPELRATDELAIRYYRLRGRYGNGGGMHPLEKIRLLHDGAVFGGGEIPLPQDVMLFDEVYSKATKFTKLFMDSWYASNDPAEVKARRLGISRSSFYSEWKAQLWYFNGALTTKGLTL